MKCTIVKLKLLTILLFPWIFACTNQHVHLAYVPGSKQSPLSTLKTLKFAIQIEDQRATGGERDLVGLHPALANFNKRVTYIRSDKEIATIFYDAFRKELENNGHEVVDTKETPSDVAIYVGLKRYWSSVTIHFFTHELVATISAHLSIRNPRKESVLLSKPIQSDFVNYNAMLGRLPELMATGILTLTIATPFHSVYVAKDEHEAALNGALNEFIRRFARDPEVLKALEVAQQYKSEEASASPSAMGKKDTRDEPK